MSSFIPSPTEGAQHSQNEDANSTFPLYLVWIFSSSFYALNFLFVASSMPFSLCPEASALSHSQVFLPSQTTWRPFPCLWEDNQLHPLTLSGQATSNRKCLWNGWQRQPNLIVRKARPEAKHSGLFHSEIFLLSGHKAVGKILNWKIFFSFCFGFVVLTIKQQIVKIGN